MRASPAEDKVRGVMPRTFYVLIIVCESGLSGYERNPFLVRNPYGLTSSNFPV